ncbi:MAG: hypothetical protein RugAbin2_02205 [Rugosibacter sp.]|nr:hypothetical protein [Rugosibacter sp.]
MFMLLSIIQLSLSLTVRVMRFHGQPLVVQVLRGRANLLLLLLKLQQKLQVKRHKSVGLRILKCVSKAQVLVVNLRCVPSMRLV